MKTNTLMPLGVRGVLIAGAIVAVFASVVMFAHADTAPTVNTTAYNSSNTAITAAPIGGSVFLTAAVASSSTTTLPTGTVTFNRYPNTSCSGTPAMQSGVSLVNGFATSSTAIMGASGLSYIATYNGNSMNASASSSCKVVTAQGSNSTLTLGLSTTSSVLAGSSVNASSTLGGLAANAGGSVAYNVYSNNSCSNVWANAGTRIVSNGVAANSDTILFSNAGTYYWRGVYTGDANNAAATSSCVALSVLATSTPSTTATISGTVYNDLNSNLSKDSGENGVPGFTVYLRQGSGFGSAVYRTATTDGNGYYSFGTLANGTYSIELLSMSGWNQETADYSSVTISNQNSLTENFAVHSNGSSTSTSTPGTISGKVYNDANQNDKLDSNESGLAGFTINLYKGAGWWGKKGMNDPIQTVVTDSNGNYVFSNLADGTYSVEQIEKSGWNQTSDDYRSLRIRNGVGLANINFSDVAKATTTPQGGHGHNGDSDQDDQGNNDNGTSTNNGNHWGWFNFWARFGSFPWGHSNQNNQD